MKLTALLAGVAAVALTAGAASAQTATPVGNIQNSGGGGSSIDLLSMSGAASQGGANGTSAATFNLSATVLKDCSFYTGGGDVDIDFGTVGIYNTSTAGLGNAFTMTGEMEAEVETSVAGCNFENTVTIRKTNGSRGLVNANPGTYDTTQFQDNIPYRVRAYYDAPDMPGQNVTAAFQAVGTGQTQNARPRGAWKSSMRLSFLAPQATLALVAGEYTDSVTVTLQAL